MWTTDVASDTMVFYGFSDAYGYDQGVIETICCTQNNTSHSQTITGLVPGALYIWGVRSRGFTKGLPDSNKIAIAIFPSQVGPNGPPSSGSFDFQVGFYGSVHLTQGYTSYVSLGMNYLQGTSSKQSVTIVLSGLPSGITVDELDAIPTGPGLCASHFDASTNTLSWNDIGCFPTPYFQLKAAANTAPGPFTLTATITTNGGVPRPKTVTWVMSVDAATPLSQGTPSSYPSIPCLMPTSKEMDGVTSCPSYGDQGYSGPINWQQTMINWGQWWCVPTQNPNNPNAGGTEQGAWYYDGERVYFQIHDYDAANGLTGNAAQWNSCALDWETSYANYVDPNNGSIPGYRIFPAGPDLGTSRGGGSGDAGRVHNLATHSAFSGLGGNAAGYEAIREAAFLIDANRYDVKLGTGSTTLLQRAVDMTLGNVDQQVYSENAKWIQPFMLGLAAEQLIHYYEDGHQSDVRIPWAIKRIADWLWTNAWNTSCTPNGFYYNSYECLNGLDRSTYVVSLNLLIAPLYAWLFKYTADYTYQAEGDAAWQAGVTQDPGNGLGFSGKNFSQQYRWSADYVTWRSHP
jgi:hypothetical protein